MSSSGIGPLDNMSSSGMNPEVTTASPSELPLWGVFLLVIVGVMVISSVFLIAVLLHNIQKRKNVRYVYQTKPVKSDKSEKKDYIYAIDYTSCLFQREMRQSTAYEVKAYWSELCNTMQYVTVIRSIDLMVFLLHACIVTHRLNSPNPKHHNYMNVWDESGNRPQEEQSEELVNQTLPTSEGAATGESNRQELEDTNPDVVYESISSSSEDIGGGFERNSITRQSIRSDAGRSIHVTHQNNFRMSVRSEAGMSRGIQRDSEGSGSARGIGVGVRIHRGNTDPAFSLPTNNNLEEGEDLQNSDPGMLPLSIHQIHPPKAAPLEKKASGAQLIAPGIIFTSSPISEIPGFKDPEILGAGASDSLEQLKIDIPPDIYSSQILRTVRSPEPESETHAEEELENQFFESGPVIITQTRKSTASLDRFLSLDPAESSGERHVMTPCVCISCIMA